MPVEKTLLHIIVVMGGRDQRKFDRVLINGHHAVGYVHGWNGWRARACGRLFQFPEQPVLIRDDGTATVHDVDRGTHELTFLKLKPVTMEDLA